MNINLDNKQAVFYPTLFLIRRLIYAICLVFFPRTFLQISITTLFSMSVLIFLLSVKPMESKVLNGIEILNETTFLLLNYISFSFTDF
jgi:hypothetical protein